MNGSEKQQKLANDLVNGFCKRFCKYLCWAFKDELFNEEEIKELVTALRNGINEKSAASWWCDHKEAQDMELAIELLNDQPEFHFKIDILKGVYFNEEE